MSDTGEKLRSDAGHEARAAKQAEKEAKKAAKKAEKDAARAARQAARDKASGKKVRTTGLSICFVGFQNSLF